jgi:RNA polymerase sigma-70 factor (ECF subfamily)
MPTDVPLDRKTAWSALYDRAMPKVYRYFLSRVRDPQTAQDLTSLTFLAALEGWPRYREEGRIEAWIFRIARHKAADHFRAQPAHILDAEWPDPQADPAQSQQEADRKRRLSKAVSRLGPDEAELLRLRFSAGLSFPEMARTLGKREEAVKKSVYRLMARLEAEVGHE